MTAAAKTRTHVALAVSAGLALRVFFVLKFPVTNSGDAPFYIDLAWNWLKKGVPLVCEIGPRDLQGGQVAVHCRLDICARGVTQNLAEFITGIPQVLGNLQTTMMEQARRYRHEMTVDDVTSLDALRRYFSEKTGFVRAKWSGNPASEDMLKEFGATIRCIPYEQRGTAGRCVLTGESATTDAIFAKAY